LSTPGGGYRLPTCALARHRREPVALAGLALTHVPGVVDLGHPLALSRQMAGQAQAVMPGARDRPGQLPVAGRGLNRRE
jgi:hypothetical protein